AENLHAQLALANSRETPSERRLDEDVHRQQRYGKESKHQIKEGDLVREVDAEVGPATQIDPVVAAGQRVPSVGQSPHALPEGEGDHQEVDAGGANSEEAENGGQRRPDQDTEQDHQPKIESQP